MVVLGEIRLLEIPFSSVAERQGYAERHETGRRDQENQDTLLMAFWPSLEAATAEL